MPRVVRRLPPSPPLSPHPAPPSAESPESPEESLEAIFGETDPRVGGGGPQFGGNVATDGVPLVYALLLPVRSPTPRPSFTSPGSLATGVPYMPVCQANHPDRWMLPAPPRQPVGRSACLVQSLQYQNKCPTCNAPAKRRDMRSCEQVDAILGHFAVLKSEGCVPVTQ